MMPVFVAAAETTADLVTFCQENVLSLLQVIRFKEGTASKRFRMLMGYVCLWKRVWKSPLARGLRATYPTDKRHFRRLRRASFDPSAKSTSGELQSGAYASSSHAYMLNSSRVWVFIWRAGVWLVCKIQRLSIAFWRKVTWSSSLGAQHKKCSCWQQMIFLPFERC